MSSIPAWKRLGLMLKPASEEQSGSPTSSTNTRATAASLPGANGSPTAAKRKLSGASATDYPAKRPRNDDLNSATTRNPPLTKKKSVSFAAEPVEFPPPSATANGKQKLKEQNKPAKSPAKKQTAVNLGPAVDYLRQWHDSRDEWKFNKNNQSKLLENVFADETTIPAVDINIFYEYIRDLKGYVRIRLRESAEELKRKDMEQGSKIFSASSKEVAERRQKEYEETITGYLREGRTPEKRRFEEMEYVLRTADMEMQRRVVKRMRAEMIIDELSDSEDKSSTTAASSTPESEGAAGNGVSQASVGEDDGDKRLKLNDGTHKRKRKARTTDVEESSSSESDSDDSETSSSVSSSEDEDEDEEINNTGNQDNDTSSSSSSSSSESDSDSEEDDDDE